MRAQPRLLHDFTVQLKGMVSTVRITQVRGLALVAVGLLCAERVALVAVAQALPLTCHLSSTERRLRRWLASPRNDVETLWPPLLRALVSRWANGEVVLVFDPTPYRKDATMLVLSLVTNGRALPVSWRIMPQQESWPQAMGTSLRAMVAEVQAALAPACTVTMLADRGLMGPMIIDVCQEVGWHVVSRLRAVRTESTLVRRPGCPDVRLGRLVTRPGQRLRIPAAIYKGAGWRTGWLTIHWARTESEPLVLFSDRPGGPDRVREYRQRMHAEALYQDWKRRGFDLEHSHITKLDRLARLVLALALATWWLFGLGCRVIRSGIRRCFDRSDRRDRSLIQLGRAYLARCFLTEETPALPFRKTPIGEVFRWQL